ncbi:MAG: 23S rRNA (uracil(1939)-C(5))-methyltransferase RlmD [Bacteroidota bacterium]
MKKNKKKYALLEHITITSLAAEGKALAKHDGKVIFVPYAAPGDVVDIQIIKQKQSFAEGRIQQMITPSPNRVTPQCEHFGKCGGCKWQHVSYREQLDYKEQQVKNDLQRIGKVEVGTYLPILGSELQWNYRNKVEFTFSNKAWEEFFDKENPKRIPALGFHIPGMFDKVLDINECHIIPETANIIRDALKGFCIEKAYPFFDIRQQTGWLRNVVIRNNSSNEWLVVLIVTENDEEALSSIFNHMTALFPQVKSWCYVINAKQNDTWSDLPVHTFSGPPFLTEQFEDLKFKIRPQSFFQTNTQQALRLYEITRDFADLKPDNNVYDLYTGTGTIALFVAKFCKQVVGIEYVPAAIEDAKENAINNKVTNTHFYAGDMKHVLNQELIERHGKPDVIITDPPRDGMHPDVVKQILFCAPEKIVYVSCNSATQARDIALLSEMYDVVKSQPVDMFPHTHHVENVALLVLKTAIA